jgi:hypothetical protein
VAGGALAGLRQSTRGRDESPPAFVPAPVWLSAVRGRRSPQCASRGPGPNVAPGRLPSVGGPALRRPHLAAASGSAPPLLAPNRSATPGGSPADVPLRRQPGTHRVPFPLAGCRPLPPGSIPASHRPPLALRPVGRPGLEPPPSLQPGPAVPREGFRRGAGPRSLWRRPRHPVVPVLRMYEEPAPATPTTSGRLFSGIFRAAPRPPPWTAFPRPAGSSGAPYFGWSTVSAAYRRRSGTTRRRPGRRKRRPSEAERRPVRTDQPVKEKSAEIMQKS